jgi:hypothetical protein
VTDGDDTTRQTTPPGSGVKHVFIRQVGIGFIIANKNDKIIVAFNVNRFFRSLCLASEGKLGFDLFCSCGKLVRNLCGKLALHE